MNFKQRLASYGKPLFFRAKSLFHPLSYCAVGEVKFPSTLFKGWQVQDSVLVAHRNERNTLNKGRHINIKLRLAPGPQAALHPASLSRHHIPHPRRLCQRQTGPGPSAPAPSRQRPTFVGPLPCPAARQQTVHRGKPLWTPAVSVRVTRQSADAPDVIVLPL